MSQLTKVNVVDPYASSYPKSWGSAVKVKTKNGDSFEVSRKDCKGDPELPLSDSEMLIKAKGLLAFAGQDKIASETVCNEVLCLPENNATPDLFKNFLKHLDLSARL